MNNDREQAIKDNKRNHYKQCTDEIFMLYDCFIESGFSLDQAFELASTYVRQTMFDNIINANKKSDRYKSRYDELIRRMGG